MTGSDLWTCPRCGRLFANRNQTHSCGHYSVEGFLEGKSARAVDLFRQFAGLVYSCGPVIVAPAKSRIGFQVRMIFAAVNKLSGRGLDAHVILTRKLDSPRFRRIDQISPTCFVHHFRVAEPGELDAEVKSWLAEAYRVGTQENKT